MKSYRPVSYLFKKINSFKKEKNRQRKKSSGFRMSGFGPFFKISFNGNIYLATTFEKYLHVN